MKKKSKASMEFAKEMDLMRKAQLIKDKVESTKESIGVFVQEITVLPDNLFTGKVVKSGNGASISFKKKFIGREVYIIVKE